MPFSVAEYFPFGGTSACGAPCVVPIATPHDLHMRPSWPFELLRLFRRPLCFTLVPSSIAFSTPTYYCAAKFFLHQPEPNDTAQSFATSVNRNEMLQGPIPIIVGPIVALQKFDPPNASPILTLQELPLIDAIPILMLQEFPLPNASPILMLQDFPLISAIPILMLQTLPLNNAIPILMLQEFPLINAIPILMLQDSAKSY